MGQISRQHHDPEHGLLSRLGEPQRPELWVERPTEWSGYRNDHGLQQAIKNVGDLRDIDLASLAEDYQVFSRPSKTLQEHHSVLEVR